MQSLRFTQSFESLSIHDLLDARDAYHYDLINKPNVVATAVGRFRIVKGTPWPSANHPEESHLDEHHHSTRRTLFNSEIRPYSWPCIYVFVNQWMSYSQLKDPNDAIPRSLSLKDGRSVPVCIIEAMKQLQEEDNGVNFFTNSPTNFYGPGTAIENEFAQGLPRIATAACVVHDGQKFYALTNNHALGEQGTEIHGFKGNKKAVIGKTSGKYISRKPFSEVYPQFQCRNQYLQMDIGLIELENIMDWKTEAFNLGGNVGSVVDLYDRTFSFKLLGQTIVGNNSRSGMVRGQIQALFYRYKSIGGYEYISDFLIGPEPGQPREEKAGENVSFNIQHGDSGMLLFIEQAAAKDALDQQPTHYPVALLWGKNQIIEDDSEKSRPFALATALSTVLNILELDFQFNLNYNNEYTWGFVGHYMIASRLTDTISLLENDKLHQFAEKNQKFISIPETALSGDKKPSSPKPRVDGKSSFVQLADVPDNVWKPAMNKTVGADGKNHPSPEARTKPADNSNHFADIDLPNKKRGNKTLLAYSLDDPENNFRPSVWVDFFAELHPLYDEWYALLDKPAKKDKNKHWGALPFRIWQIFDEMVQFVEDGKAESFLCAGGILAHYVGDACQPLHTSFMANGNPSVVVDGKKGKEPEGTGVHTGYEDDMVNYKPNRQEIMKKLPGVIILQKKLVIRKISSGYEAGLAALELIQATQKALPAKKIVDKWVSLSDKKPAAKAMEMWLDFGLKTIDCMAMGCRYLAAIWDAAWVAGNGDKKIDIKTEITEAGLMKLYTDKKFLKSVDLPDYTALLKFPGSTPDETAKKVAKKAAKKVAKKK